MNRLILLASLVAMGTGCATKIRNVTAEAWSNQGVYVGYWEGTCKAVLGCDRGDGYVQWCRLDPDENRLLCDVQDAITPLLARKPTQPPPPPPAPKPAPMPEPADDMDDQGVDRDDEGDPDQGVDRDDEGDPDQGVDRGGE